MQLDRSKQLVILEALASVYPRHDVNIGTDLPPSESDLANLWYLQEQGLVEAVLQLSLSQSFIYSGARITAKGMDFLADDGGLSAILGTVTVRLHPETIKELLLARIEASAPPEKKSWLRKQLEAASNETVKKIVNAVLDEGIKHAPDLLKVVEQVVQNTP